MNTLHLHRNEIKAIVNFMDVFGSDDVELSNNDSSGIGGILIARINSVVVKDIEVNVERIIADEKDW
jgi:hypothetical protein